MTGIIELIAIVITIGVAYYGHEKFIADKLDTPKNNEAVKGLEKKEIKDKIKEDETTKKAKEKEIKAKETERQKTLKSQAEDKAEQAQEILEAKEELQKEVKELEAKIKDLKLVEQGGYMANVPNKLT
jgi:predicted NodU family carbamoyl transferase